jgi:hypothetical protein
VLKRHQTAQVPYLLRRNLMQSKLEQKVEVSQGWLLNQ